jgi:tryptophan-rich sensory protein
MMRGLLGYGWLPILISSAGSAAIMIAGGILTEIGPWYRNLTKPSWQPADWVFGPVWTIIYILVTLATVMVWNASGGVAESLLLVTAYLLNGLLNIGWSLVFFKWQRPDWAFLEVITLWLSTFLLAVAYYIVLPKAGWLIAPYLVWVTIAAYLNLTIIRLNQPFAEKNGFDSGVGVNNA